MLSSIAGDCLLAPVKSVASFSVVHHICDSTLFYRIPIIIGLKVLFMLILISLQVLYLSHTVLHNRLKMECNFELLYL